MEELATDWLDHVERWSNIYELLQPEPMTQLEVDILYIDWDGHVVCDVANGGTVDVVDGKVDVAIMERFIGDHLRAGFRHFTTLLYNVNVLPERVQQYVGTGPMDGTGSTSYTFPLVDVGNAHIVVPPSLCIFHPTNRLFVLYHLVGADVVGKNKRKGGTKRVRFRRVLTTTQKVIHG